MCRAALSMGGFSMRIKKFTMKLLDVFTTETFVAEEPLVRAAVNNPHIFVNPDISPMSVPSRPKPTIHIERGKNIQRH